MVIDETTGEILDNAQGYGYKSAQKAYAVYRYKHSSIEEIEKEHVTKKLVKELCKTHREFCSFMSGVVWDSIKTPTEKITGKYVEKFLKEQGITDVPFIGKEFLKYAELKLWNF